MHNETTLYQMKKLNLTTMANSFESRLNAREHIDLSHEEFLALLINDEFEGRKTRKLKRMIKTANFRPEKPCLENIKKSSFRGFKNSDIAQFRSDTWIKNAQNIVLTGATGSGKTYIAEAIALQACKMEYSCSKKRFKILFEEIRDAKGTGMYLKYLNKISKFKILIIDDFIMNDISNDDLNDLMDIIELREQLSPIIITTQYPVDAWHKKMSDPTIADAICDRLLKGAYVYDLKGESMRKSNLI